MNLKTAIEILESHQAWRSGKDVEMVNPKKLTEAINLVLNEVKKLNK